MSQAALQKSSAYFTIDSLEKIVPLRRLTVSEYHRMGEDQILKDDEHVELIEGMIIKMSPKGTKHSAVVSKLSTPFYELVLQNKVLLRVQDSVVLTDNSEPEPDLAIVKPRVDVYMDRHPHPDDVQLLIEVSDTTLEKDRKIKLPIYAASGIPEVWIVNLVEKIVEVYRKPILLEDGTAKYEIGMNFIKGEKIFPQVFPDKIIAVSDILA